jgi:hypothetical protein
MGLVSIAPSRRKRQKSKDWESLENSLNPFSVVVMAHLRTLATRGDTTSRLQQ